MPRSSKKPPPNRKGNNDPMNMMGFGMFGMDDSGDDHNEDLEAELQQILGGGPKPKSAKAKPQGKQLLDWSELDAQISASMKDVDDAEDDDDIDDVDLMSELDDIVAKDDSSLHAPTPNKRRSPSPQPQAAGGSQLDILYERKKMYESAMQNAQAANQSAKVRRLQRGSKTLDGLIKTAKAGKPVNDEDIPPMVAIGKSSAESSSAKPPESATPLVDISAAMETSPSKAPPPVAPKPSPIVENKPQVSQQSSSDNDKSLQILLTRQQEFKKLALASKQDGDKAKALGYFKIMKQFDAVISAAREGKPVDLSQMPQLPGTSQGNKPPPPISSRVAESAPSSQTPSMAPQQSSTAGASQPSATSANSPPKTMLEGLLQRQRKYQSSAEQAKQEGNSSKARRMARIAKQYDDAIKLHKAGKQFDIASLPVPMGFPPLPGSNEKVVDPSDMFNQAQDLLKVDDDDATEPKIESVRQAQRASPQPPHTQPKTHPKNPAPAEKLSAYQQQIQFLENRKDAFKQAALAAKKNGDKQTAMEMLRKMKGFDPMLQQAKNGLKVDISKVPQPPLIAGSAQNNDDFEILDSPKDHEYESQESRDDQEIYSTLLKTLKDQIQKARGYSQQFTHLGDINGANMFDRLAEESQQDYNFVKNLQRHNDAPPRYYFENKTFTSVHIIPELNSNELEIIIKKIMNLDGKDLKPFVEWELPFPHDNPAKGRTDEVRTVNNMAQYDAPFRIPINRKSKSFQRAIKNKVVKFAVIQRGGFLRSDKSLGTAAVKLSNLETTCEVHAIESLKEGRAEIGKIEVKVRMRTPLIGSESQTSTERWMIVKHDHVASRAAPRPSQGRSSTSSHSKHQSSPKKKELKIGSLEVLALEKKMVDAKIQSFEQKGQQPPTSALQNLQSVQAKITATKNYLHGGGINAKKNYVQYLKSEVDNLTKEAQAAVRHGNHDQAKFILTKKKMIEKEISKMAPSNTYL